MRKHLRSLALITLLGFITPGVIMPSYAATLPTDPNEPTGFTTEELDGRFGAAEDEIAGQTKTTSGEIPEPPMEPDEDVEFELVVYGEQLEEKDMDQFLKNLASTAQDPENNYNFVDFSQMTSQNVRVRNGGPVGSSTGVPQMWQLTYKRWSRERIKHVFWGQTDGTTGDLEFINHSVRAYVHLTYGSEYTSASSEKQFQLGRSTDAEDVSYSYEVMSYGYGSDDPYAWLQRAYEASKNNGDHYLIDWERLLDPNSGATISFVTQEGGSPESGGFRIREAICYGESSSGCVPNNGNFFGSMNVNDQAGKYIEFRELDGRMTEQGLGFDYFSLFTRNKAPESIWFDPNDPLVSQTSRGPVEDASDSENARITLDEDASLEELSPISADASSKGRALSVDTSNKGEGKVFGDDSFDNPIIFVIKVAAGRGLSRLFYGIMPFRYQRGDKNLEPLPIEVPLLDFVSQLVQVLDDLAGMDFGIFRQLFNLFDEIQKAIYEQVRLLMRPYYEKLVEYLAPLLQLFEPKIISQFGLNMPEVPEFLEGEVSDEEWAYGRELDRIVRVIASEALKVLITDVNLRSEVNAFIDFQMGLAKKYSNLVQKELQKKWKESIVEFLSNLMKEIKTTQPLQVHKEKGYTDIFIQLSPAVTTQPR